MFILKKKNLFYYSVQQNLLIMKNVILFFLFNTNKFIKEYNYNSFASHTHVDIFQSVSISSLFK